jgi:hypothetical protein
MSRLITEIDGSESDHHSEPVEEPQSEDPYPLIPEFKEELNSDTETEI